jgi:uncharacterized protein (DUF1501 family)
MMTMNRNTFIKNLLHVGAGAAASKLLGLDFAVANENPAHHLVVVFLRGGCDALNFLAPLDGDDRKIYEDERPNIKMPTSGPGALIKIADHVGLHPSAEKLHELFRGSHLAFYQATGLTSNTRSHFDAQAYMELGTPDKKGTPTGWLTRHLLSPGQPKSISPFTALNIGPLAPSSLLGFEHSLSLLNPQRVSVFNGDKNLQKDFLSSLRIAYTGETNLGSSNWLTEVGQQTLNAIDTLSGLNTKDYQPPKGVEYPKCEIGNRLKTLAQIIRMDLGTQVATVDMGGWDTHKNQGQGTDGVFAKNVEQLSESLHAFYIDLAAGQMTKKLTIVVMTEFGRRLRENANRGTDHGHGGLMMVIGEDLKGSLEGGKIHGQWPGIKTENLFERADLAVTTDFRVVLGDILKNRLHNPHPVFT